MGISPEDIKAHFAAHGLGPEAIVAARARQDQYEKFIEDLIDIAHEGLHADTPQGMAAATAILRQRVGHQVGDEDLPGSIHYIVGTLLVEIVSGRHRLGALSRERASAPLSGWPSHWSQNDVLQDLHARYHGQRGNLIGAGDCGWEKCTFWEVATFVAEARP